MRNKSNAGSGIAEPFIVEKVDEMAAYDALPAILRRALDTAAGEFSAAQAQDWIRSGRYSAEQIAALIMGHTREQQQARLAECPARPTHRRVR